MSAEQTTTTSTGKPGHESGRRKDMDSFIDAFDNTDEPILTNTSSTSEPPPKKR